MKADSSNISAMVGHQKEDKDKEKSPFIQSLIKMDWKGMVAVIIFTSPIFWVLIFNKTDERYLQLRTYQENESRKTEVYTKDQTVLKETLSEIRNDQKEQRALIIQGIRDKSKTDSH